MAARIKLSLQRQKSGTQGRHLHGTCHAMHAADLGSPSLRVVQHPN